MELQQALDNAVTLNKYARPSIDDLILKAVLLNVRNDCLVFGTRLEPQCRDIERLGLLKNAQSNLTNAYIQTPHEKSESEEDHLRRGYDTDRRFGGRRQIGD